MFSRKGCRGTDAERTAPARTPRRAPRYTNLISIVVTRSPRPASAKVIAVSAARHTLATAGPKMSFGANHDSYAGVEVKEEEEETPGQLRDRQVLAFARASAPGRRAVFVHIKVEDTDGEGAGGGDGEEATGGEGDEGAEQEEDEDQAEEEEVGQQREQHAQAPGASFEGRTEAGADAVALPRRARLPPRRYADAAVELDTEEDYEKVEEEEDEEWDEDEGGEKEEAQTRDQRAHAPSTGLKGGNEAVRPQSLTPGAHSEPGSLQARLRAPGRRVTDKAVQDNDVQQPEDEEEGEAGFAPVLKKRSGGGHAGSSQFAGVCWVKRRSRWEAKCKGQHLGYHSTEEAAPRAYSKYLEDGVVPEPKERAGYGASQFKGVHWNKSVNKWAANRNGTHLGCHVTEQDAARAYNTYLEDGIDPVKHRAARTSQFTGVSWNKNKNTWTAKCKGNHLGQHSTEEAAVRAYNKYVSDGINPVKHREANTSLFMGVSWTTSKNKWVAQCKGKYLGLHTTEEAAARAYNVEAERRGLTLNVIPPVRRAADAGTSQGAGVGSGADPMYATLKTPASPAANKKTKRADLTTQAAPAPNKKMTL